MDASAEKVKKVGEWLGTASADMVRARRDIDGFLASYHESMRRMEDESRGYRLEYEHLAVRLIEILDDFEAGGWGELSDREKAEYVRKRIEDAVRREGISPIVVEERTFDPGKHDAVKAVLDEDAPEGTIAEVVRKGYAKGPRVIRKAGVIVTKMGG